LQLVLLLQLHALGDPENAPEASLIFDLRWGKGTPLCVRVCAILFVCVCAHVCVHVCVCMHACVRVDGVEVCGTMRLGGLQGVRLCLTRECARRRWPPTGRYSLCGL